MNGILDVQDFSSVDLNQANEAPEAPEALETNAMGHGVSFSEVESRQKFKSRHFPEPYWGHDDN